MNKKTIRLIGLVFTVSLFIILSFYLNIENYFHYVILCALIYQGVKCIFDLFLGFTVSVGYSGPLKNTDKNEIPRVVAFVVGVLLAAFAVWWIVDKGV